MPLFPNFRTWHMINVDTGETLRGQYEAAGISENVGVTYGEHTSLNRQNAALQFLHGNADTLSFQARIFASHAFQSVKGELERLKAWTRRQDREARPPIIIFWIGDASVYIECVIDSLSDISYDRFGFSGEIRGATLTVNLRQYVPFSIEGGEPAETRYHRARRRDYYEGLTWREYGNALLGDVIRKRHPTKPHILAGDIIKLPSLAAIRRERVTPRSLALQGAYEKRDTPQRQRLREMLDSRNRTYVSHELLEA